jgi:hypothetical protein
MDKVTWSFKLGASILPSSWYLLAAAHLKPERRWLPRAVIHNLKLPVNSDSDETSAQKMKMSTGSLDRHVSDQLETCAQL